MPKKIRAKQDVANPNIEPTIRGEMLSIQKIVILSNELYKLQMNF